MTFSLPRGGAMGPSWPGHGAGSRHLDARQTRGNSAARLGRHPMGHNKSLVVVLAAAAGAGSNGFTVGATVATRLLARRALLASTAAAGPLFLAAKVAWAKKDTKQHMNKTKAPPPSRKTSPSPTTTVDLAGRRLVAIGDVHGDFAQTMAALELGKVMGGDGNWIGGDTVLVQVGDILDRGDNELAIMRKFRNLALQVRVG